MQLNLLQLNVLALKKLQAGGPVVDCQNLIPISNLHKIPNESSLNMQVDIKNAASKGYLEGDMINQFLIFLVENDIFHKTKIILHINNVNNINK